MAQITAMMQSANNSGNTDASTDAATDVLTKYYQSMMSAPSAAANLSMHNMMAIISGSSSSQSHDGNATDVTVKSELDGEDDDVDLALECESVDADAGVTKKRKADSHSADAVVDTKKPRRKRDMLSAENLANASSSAPLVIPHLGNDPLTLMAAMYAQATAGGAGSSAASASMAAFQQALSQLPLLHTNNTNFMTAMAAAATAANTTASTADSIVESAMSHSGANGNGMLPLTPNHHRFTLHDGDPILSPSVNPSHLSALRSDGGRIGRYILPTVIPFEPQRNANVKSLSPRHIGLSLGHHLQSPAHGINALAASPNSGFKEFLDFIQSPARAPPSPMTANAHGTRRSSFTAPTPIGKRRKVTQNHATPHRSLSPLNAESSNGGGANNVSIGGGDHNVFNFTGASCVNGAQSIVVADAAVASTAHNGERGV